MKLLKQDFFFPGDSTENQQSSFPDQDASYNENIPSTPILAEAHYGTDASASVSRSLFHDECNNQSKCVY